MADPVGEERPLSGGALLVGAMVVYGGLTGAGWLWLSWRERVGCIPTAGAGTIGLVASMAVGVVVGLALTGALSVAARYSVRMARLETRVAQLVGPLTETQIVVLSVCSAIGEEFFFRLAAQDALGLWPAAALFGVVNLGPRQFLLWPLVAFALGLAFGSMMQLGCGLLGVTAAHALINYLSLRRMQQR